MNALRPNRTEIDRFLVVTLSTPMAGFARAAGFACVGESDLIDDDGLGVKPLARTCLEAAKQSNREIVLVILEPERWYLDGISGLFKAANVGFDRVEVIDPTRYKADPQGEIVRRILRLEPVEESLTGPRGIATPLSALAERYGSLTWVWPNWMAKGLLHLISGESGAGKTTVTTDIIMRIFDGADLPDGAKPPPDLKGKRVLYIDADLRASHQLTALANGYKLASDPFDIFEIADPEGVPRTVSTWEDDPRLFDHLEAVLEAGSHWCLVVDTASRFTGSVDLTNPSDLTRWVNPLLNIARNLNLSVLILGHSNGSGGAFGRHLPSACQLGWKIGKDGSLECVRSYAAPPETLGFSFNQAGGPLEWQRLGGASHKPRRPRSRLEEWILTHLRDLAEKPVDIQNTLNGWSTLWAEAKEAGVCGGGKSSFSRALDRLVGDGLVEKVEARGPNEGRFHRYRAIMDPNQ